MVTYEVTLLNKRTFEGKKVYVEASEAEGAFQKARMIQSFPGMWATLTAKVEASRMKSRFQHKGLAKR